MRSIFKITLATLFGLLFSFTSIAQEAELYYRVRIALDDQHTHHGLLALGLAVDHVDKETKNTLVAELSDTEVHLMKQAGYHYVVLIEDMATYYAQRAAKDLAAQAKTTEQNSCLDCKDYTVPLNFTNGSMGGYYTYQQMLDILDSMKAKYPNLITAKQALPGATTVNGNSIYWLKISDNPNTDESEPEVLYDALHHAREPQSLAQLIYYMWYLLENYNTNAEVKYLVDNTEMYFIPCLNPDGYLHNQNTNPNGGGMWRKNRRNNGTNFGVDLNRNYGSHWGYDNVGSSPNMSSDTYRGPSAFSEVETQAIKAFCESRDFVTALNTHAYGNLLIYPYGYLPQLQTSDSVVFQKQAGDMMSCNGFVSGTGDETVGYVTNGDSDDWMYETTSTKPKIFSMTPEIGLQSDGFWPAPSRIIPLAKAMVKTNLLNAWYAQAYAEVKPVKKNFIATATTFISYTFQRVGHKSENFSVQVVPLQNCSSAGAPKTYTAPAQMLLIKDSIALNISAGLSVGAPIKYLLKWSNSSGWSQNDTLTSYYGSPTPAFFSDGSSTNGFTGNFGTSTAQFVSPPAALHESPTGLYTSSTSYTLTTGAINLTNTLEAYLTYFAKWRIEKGYDYASISVSENNVSFTPLCGMYTRTGGDKQNNVSAQYDGLQREWVKENINLKNYVGKTIYLRMLLKSDNGTNLDGIYIDDFLVEKLAKPNALSELTANRIAINFYPNPATEEIHLSLSEAAPASLYNIGGTLLKTLPPTTKQTIDVSTLPRGVYFIKVQDASVRFVKY